MVTMYVLQTRAVLCGGGTENVETRCTKKRVEWSGPPRPARPRSGLEPPSAGNGSLVNPLGYIAAGMPVI